MKEKMTHMNRMTAIYVGLVFFGLSCLAAASDVRLTADPSIPAAKGKAHLSKDKNGNLKVKVEIYHLAKPDALTPSRQSYVIWTQVRGKDAENRGVLKVNNKLEGNFEDTVSNEEFEVFITAEDNSRAEVPSEPKLLRGTRQP